MPLAPPVMNAVLPSKSFIPFSALLALSLGGDMPEHRHYTGF
jgi:hypothetical protein